MSEVGSQGASAGARASGGRWPAARRIVAKVGSSTLMGPDGRLDEGFIGQLADQICELADEGREVVLVSSGAIAAGVALLGLGERPGDMASLQACAAVGQVGLVDTYARTFSARGRLAAQVLLTRSDTALRSSYLHARQTIDRLLGMGVVPVVNENDTVAVDEIRFGDNDSLAAIVGSLVGADLVVLLSDIDGLYTADPRLDPDARIVPVVEHVDDALMASAGGAGSSVGTGGMRTKVRAGRMMQMAGIPLTICAGRSPHVLADVARGHDVGTRFVVDPTQARESSRKLWIALAGCDRGRVTIDEGARRALHERGGSLLPVGVTQVEGTWSPGELVAVYDEQGTLVGRGLAGYSSAQAELVRGMRSEMVARVAPELAGVPFIHRDELVVF